MNVVVSRGGVLVNSRSLMVLNQASSNWSFGRRGLTAVLLMSSRLSVCSYNRVAVFILSQYDCVRYHFILISVYSSAGVVDSKLHEDSSWVKLKLTILHCCFEFVVNYANFPRM